MRTVTVSDFEAQLDELLAAAEGGEQFLLVRDGKPAARLGPATDDRHNRAERQRAVVGEIVALGREHLRQFGPTTADEIVAWKNEGRR